MICAYHINEYAYCHRRYWYISHGINPTNEEIEEGKIFHARTANRMLKNIFFEDRKLGLKGKVDYLTKKDKLTLYELKKGKARTLWNNDHLQALAYLVLAKKSKTKIDGAYVKYGNGRKFKVDLKEDDETKIKGIIKEMQELKNIPPRCSKNKCKGCNLKHYCWS